MTTDELKVKINEMNNLINYQQFDKAKEIFDEIAPLLIKSFSDVVCAINRAFEEAFSWIEDFSIEIIDDFVNAIILTYPKKKVVNLALYHPRAKVRKKNKRRIFKWLHKMIYYDFQYSAAKEVIM